MALLNSDRIRASDWAIWRDWEEHDRILAGILKSKLEAKAQRAIADIKAFLGQGEAYFSISWGKDSVVTAYLGWLAAKELGIRPKAGYVELTGVQFANPDCPMVRDAFFQRFPGWDYAENLYFAKSSCSPKEQAECYDQLAAMLKIGNRYITGMRAQESAKRRLRLQTQGTTTKYTCAPLMRWSVDEIFAYSSLVDLPLHPAYAMVGGGLYDRRHIRVASIGGDSGIQFNRRSWEGAYYPELFHKLEQGVKDA